ncbi:MAG: hypothetical protein K0R03_2682 [Moraxellaceae bacterium]|nr:hypothetical protein [Moraxellaceae bacterium]
MFRPAISSTDRQRRLPDNYGPTARRHSAGKRLVMEAEVVFDEGRDEVIAVVVAGVPAQRERLAGLSAGSLEQVRMQLLGEEFVAQSLVHEDAVRKQRLQPDAMTLADEFRGIVRRGGRRRDSP